MNARNRGRLSGGLCAFGIAALFVAGAPAAHATDKDEFIKGDSIVVNFGDLNLRNPAGVEQLYRRIERAATRVCHAEKDFRVLNDAIRHECVRNAVARAVKDVDNQHLTALYSRKANKALG